MLSELIERHLRVILRRKYTQAPGETKGEYMIYEPTLVLAKDIAEEMTLFIENIYEPAATKRRSSFCEVVSESEDTALAEYVPDAATLHPR
jgi:hypothetical protein